jgi:ATP-dependent protease ClpP protease subunit
MSPLIPIVVEPTAHGERAFDIYSRLLSSGSSSSAQHSGQPLEKVAKDMERDYFMTAEEAVKYGLIDKVLARRFESDARPTA